MAGFFLAIGKIIGLFFAIFILGWIVYGMYLAIWKLGCKLANSKIGSDWTIIFKPFFLLTKKGRMKIKQFEDEE